MQLRTWEHRRLNKTTPKVIANIVRDLRHVGFLSLAPLLVFLWQPRVFSKHVVWISLQSEKKKRNTLSFYSCTLCSVSALLFIWCGVNMYYPKKDMDMDSVQSSIGLSKITNPMLAPTPLLSHFGYRFFMLKFCRGLTNSTNNWTHPSEKPWGFFRLEPLPWKSFPIYCSSDLAKFL